MKFITGDNYDPNIHNLFKTKNIRNKHSFKNPEWSVWRGMRNRCHFKKNPQYSDYGGRGIGYCERWTSFDNFYEDMGSRPFPNYELDRKDNSIGYCKENCRWASKSTNCSNTRNKGSGKYPRGVGEHHKKFCARIRIEGVRYLLGDFETPEEAGAKFQEIYLEWFGVNRQ